MNKWMKIGVGVFVGLIVLSLAYFLFPKSYILISIAPDQAQLSIDGGSKRTVTSGSTIFVLAGKHTYTLSRSEFDSSTTTISSGNNQTKELLVALNPQTDAARALLGTTNSMNIIERIGGQKESQGTAALNKNYPILSILPYTSHSYTIYACSSQKYPNDASKIALCVYTSDPDAVKPLVEAALKQAGYNASDYEIIYSNDSPSSADEGSPASRGDD